MKDLLKVVVEIDYLVEKGLEYLGTSDDSYDYIFEASDKLGILIKELKE